ncbi:helix-turn-helix protein [Marinoscillum furvescens DSM 4134]|uniref:Helix-turn-helix protein n=2 Tax=Marinoscillum furvescens TaxID=1026 RepID=A0A3D9L3M9_MARFU|nr:helix-turn-helix protein [Marinoscillum furvescens DSM 4134]
MVCPRCIQAVTQTFAELHEPPLTVALGEVSVQNLPSEAVNTQLNTALNQLGFELLSPGKTALIAQIKSLIIDQVHYQTAPLRINLSTYLAEQLHQDYSHLSRLFSSTEGITIEKYLTAQKIERVKELLTYEEQTLSEIAHQLNYSSIAHLSAQFKKETGMTPTAFRKQKKHDRKTLDQVGNT